MTVLIIIIYLFFGCMVSDMGDKILERYSFIGQKTRNAILILLLLIWPVWFYIFLGLFFVELIILLANLWNKKLKLKQD